MVWTCAVAFTASVKCKHRIETEDRVTRVGIFEVCLSTHVALRIFIMQVLASQLHFLANRNVELAVPLGSNQANFFVIETVNLLYMKCERSCSVPSNIITD